MPELRGFSGREVIKILQRMGFKLMRVQGSHAILEKGKRSCIVPLHKELSIGTLKSALRQAGITADEFLQAR
ncbi:MAG: type II toxin-antitoxin system HicA family toxin [Synergistaceae bacterium]|nr:type II toxin-antitoxin system HicA family toxin [Synergistaceae bacterium]